MTIQISELKTDRLYIICIRGARSEEVEALKAILNKNLIPFALITNAELEVQEVSQ